MGIIYKCTSPSEKLYIGKTTKTLDERKKGHLSDSKRNDYAFARAIRKYGIDNLKWEILYNDIPDNLLDIAEICAIYIYDSYYFGYNSTIGGEGASGNKLSQEIKDKISLRQIGSKNHRYGKHLTDSEKINLSQKRSGDKNPFFGKKHDEETRKKLSELSSKRRHTAKSREKMSKKQSGENHPLYGKHHSESTRNLMSISSGGKKFEMFKDDVLIGEFINIAACARKFGIFKSNISACLHGRQKTYKGFTFSYKTK